MKKIIPLILSTLLLTSCSGPDSSGGVEFSKTANVFPFGSCRGSGYQTHSAERAWCGWITVDEKNYYIMPNANLSNTILDGASLYKADLSGADLSGADLSGASLTNTNLDGVDLSGAELTSTLLEGAIL